MESILNYLTEQEMNNMLNKELVHEDCRRDDTGPLWKKQKQENMTTVLNQLFADQRKKVLIGEHDAFSVI